MVALGFAGASVSDGQRPKSIPGLPNYRIEYDPQDTALNGRRLQFLTKLAEDSEFAGFLNDFKAASDQAKIDVFNQAYNRAISMLTDAARQRGTPRSVSGIIGIALGRLGLNIPRTIINRAVGVGDRPDSKREAELADLGLENAKSLIARFGDEKTAAGFDSMKPAAKTIALYRTLKTINSSQEQPSPLVVNINDQVGMNRRGEIGLRYARAIFGADDPQIALWSQNQLSRKERDEVLTRALDRMFDRAIEAVEDSSGSAARQLRKDFADSAEVGVHAAEQQLREALARAGHRLPRMSVPSTPTPAPAAKDYSRAWGNTPGGDDTGEAQRCGELMENAWRFGYGLLLGIDDLKLPARTTK